MKDIESFEEFVDQFLKPTYNFIYKLVKDAPLAEDVVQETFVKVWKNFDSYESEKSSKAWVFKIARNTAIDFLRKRKNVLFSELTNNDEENFESNIKDGEILPDELFIKKEAEAQLVEALNNLDLKYKEVIVLHDMEDQTFQEISEILNKPLNTVKSLYRRGLHQLRESIRI